MERCRSRQKPAFDLEALLAAVGKGTDAAPKYRERFVVFVGDSVIPVNTADIAFLYSEDKYNHLVTSAGADYIIDGSMEAMSEDLDLPNHYQTILEGTWTLDLMQQNMMLAATDLGIDNIYLWMSMYGINESPEIMQRLGFPEGFTCVGTMALGYAAKEFPKVKAAEQRIEVTYIK